MILSWTHVSSLDAIVGCHITMVTCTCPMYTITLKQTGAKFHICTCTCTIVSFKYMVQTSSSYVDVQCGSTLLVLPHVWAVVPPHCTHPNNSACTEGAVCIIVSHCIIVHAFLPEKGQLCVSISHHPLCVQHNIHVEKW